MKKTLLILCALLLTAVGASAQTVVHECVAEVDHWTIAGNTNGDFHYNDWSVEDDASGMVVPFLEYWVWSGEGNLSAATISHETLEDLTPGYYEVSLDIRIFSEAGNEIGEGTTFTANTVSEDLVSYGTADVYGTETEEYGTYVLTCYVDEDGTLDISLTIPEGVEYNWISFKNLTVTYLGEAEADHFCRADLSHWSISGNTSGSFQRNTWSVEADASGMTTPFIEYWIGAGTDLAAATISHETLTDLTAGYYKVSIFARAFDEATSTSAEVAGEIAEGYMFFTANSDSIDLTTGTHGIYNDYSREVYGTYELIAEVAQEGTLDIGFTISGDSDDDGNKENCDWLAFKNLKVEYMGTTIDYEINEPECSAKVVQPGDEVSIVYECITPDTSKEPTLDTTKSITVGGVEAEASLDCAGYSATVTFTIPEITLGEDVTISVPEGLIYWNLQEEDEDAENVLSPAATFTVHTPATIADGDYLIMNSDGNYLAGGLAWGTQAMEGGKPQFFTFEAQTDGTYTLDSHQSNGGDSHYLGEGLYCDAESAHWTLVAVDGGYALFDAGANRYVTGNGFQVAVTLSDEPTVWTLVTKDEIIATMADATEDNPVDVSALIPACEPKRNAWGASWTMTAYDGVTTINNGSLGQDANVASCAESYYSSNGFDIRQSVTFPKKGVYVLSAQAFYSGTAGAVMYVSSSDATGYNTDGNSVALPAQGETSASNMVTAYQEFLEELHTVSLQFTVDSDETTLYVGFSSAADSNSAWNIFGELGLQYLGVEKETVTWEMTTANWATLILPFDVAAEDVPEDLTIYTCDGTETDEETETTTVTTTEVTDGIAANTPYLVKGNVTDDTEYTFSGTPVDATNGLTEGLLTGTFDDMDYDDLVALETDGSTVYLLQNHTTDEGGNYGVGFYPVVTTDDESSEATLTPYHCYLTYSAISPNSVPAKLTLGFAGTGGEETGIMAVEGTEVASDAIYDLVGRRVAKAVKGVYIMNGKKVLVK